MDVYTAHVKLMIARRLLPAVHSLAYNPLAIRFSMSLTVHSSLSESIVRPMLWLFLVISIWAAAVSSNEALSEAVAVKDSAGSVPGATISSR
jgi:hypothetical protein